MSASPEHVPAAQAAEANVEKSPPQQKDEGAVEQVPEEDVRIEPLIPVPQQEEAPPDPDVTPLIFASSSPTGSLAISHEILKLDESPYSAPAALHPELPDDDGDETLPASMSSNEELEYQLKVNKRGEAKLKTGVVTEKERNTKRKPPLETTLVKRGCDEARNINKQPPHHLWDTFIEDRDFTQRPVRTPEAALERRFKRPDNDVDNLHPTDLARKLWVILLVLREQAPTVYPVMSARQMLVLLHVLMATYKVRKMPASLEPTKLFVEFVDAVCGLPSVVNQSKKSKNVLSADVVELRSLIADNETGKPQRVFKMEKSLNGLLKDWFNEFNSDQPMDLNDKNVTNEFYDALQSSLDEGKVTKFIEPHPAGLVGVLQLFALSADFFTQIKPPVKLLRNLKKNVTKNVWKDKETTASPDDNVSIPARTYDVTFTATDNEMMYLARSFWLDPAAIYTELDEVDWNWTVKSCSRDMRAFNALTKKMARTRKHAWMKKRDQDSLFHSPQMELVPMITRAPVPQVSPFGFPPKPGPSKIKAPATKPKVLGSGLSSSKQVAPNIGPSPFPSLSTLPSMSQSRSASDRPSSSRIDTNTASQPSINPFPSRPRGFSSYKPTEALPLALMSNPDKEDPAGVFPPTPQGYSSSRDNSEAPPEYSAYDRNRTGQLSSPSEFTLSQSEDELRNVAWLQRLVLGPQKPENAGYDLLHDVINNPPEDDDYDPDNRPPTPSTNYSRESNPDSDDGVDVVKYLDTYNSDYEDKVDVENPEEDFLAEGFLTEAADRWGANAGRDDQE